MATKVSERPTCKCCGRPLKPVRRWACTDAKLTDQQKTMSGCYPRTIEEAAALYGFTPERVKRGPRPIRDFEEKPRYWPAARGPKPPSHEMVCVTHDYDESDSVILEGTAESGRFGYEGSGHFCTFRCGYEFGLATSRALVRHKAVRAKMQTKKG